MNKYLKLFTILLTVAYCFASTVAPTLAAITYTYDANGNMTSDGTTCYHYDEANQLDKVTKCSTGQTIAEYVYDYNGNRIIKKNYTNGTLNNTVTSWSDSFETKTIAGGGTENTTYYHVNNELVAKKNPDGTKQYYHNDHLGSTSVLTNQAGALVEETKYDPWGEVKSGGTKSKFLYTGQEKDGETGLNYYNYRYYDSHIRRFTQPDDIIQDPYNPQDLNRYSYVRNNPLKYTDPSGHIAWVPIIIIGAGSAYGGTEAVASYSLENPNATWQQKTLVGVGGAVIGGAATAATLYRAASLPAVGLVGGVSSGAQQVYTNYVSGNRLDKNVASQSLVGASTALVGVGGVKLFNLVPNKVGRPITMNNDRKLADTFTKNSLNAINKATVPELISNKLKVIANSLFAIFSNTGNNKKHTKKFK